MSSKITMNKSTAYIIGAIVVLVLAGTYMGASYVADKNSDRVTLQTDEGKVSRGIAQKYENTSLKDKEALSNLISTLAGGSSIDDVEPHTEKKPFGIRLHGTDKLTGKELEQLSEQLLSLVKDCEWVEINTNQFHSKMTRDGLQEFSVLN